MTFFEKFLNSFSDLQDNIMNGQNNILKVMGLILDLILPRKCAVCGTVLRNFEKHLCTKCLADFPYTFYWKLPHNPMADKFNEKIQDYYYSGDCPDKFPSSKISYSYASALFFFNSEAQYRHIQYKIKYCGDICLGRFFGRILGEKICKSDHLHDIDIIIPVPLYWSRRLKRGYNQAEIIAEGIADSTKAKLCTAILYRTRSTKTQTKLSVNMKALNVRGAFKAKRRLDGRHHILLVDDVFTTGATLCSCYAALREAAPECIISIATLATVSN